MKRQLMTGLFAALAFTAVAQSNEWRDPEVNAVNRAPMHANFFAYETAEVAAKDAKEQSQNFMTLNGPWKFFWVKNAERSSYRFLADRLQRQRMEQYACARCMGTERIWRSSLRKRWLRLA